MIRYENDCVDCATDGYHHCNPFCRLKRAKHFYCDKCGAEDDLFLHNDQQLCIYCLDEETDGESGELVAVNGNEEQ